MNGIFAIMHNNVMNMLKNFDFVTDMAIESAQSTGHLTNCDAKPLSYGIVKRTLRVKTIEDAKKTGREKGVYVTFDCVKETLEGQSSCEYLTKQIAFCLAELVGIVKKSSPVLVVGLGNRHIVADSLGQRCVEGVKVTRYLSAVGKQSLCAFSTGVLGMTGIQSAELVSGAVSKIKPSCVILIDSLATGAVSRLGKSFQISSCGISPGSGVGQDKERIDKSVLSVPTFSIGVPLLLSLRTGIYTFVKELAGEEKLDINEYNLRAKLAKNTLSDLIVAPRDIDYVVGVASNVVSKAINLAFKL